MDAIAADDHGEFPRLAIPEAQLSFLKKIRQTIEDPKNGYSHKSKLVVVLTGGCPVLLNEIRELADALIYAWYPGEEGGTAFADLLFGRISPSGHTPLTFVKSLDQLPPFDDYSMKGRTYRYMDSDVLYPFGYGLSYTTFDYSNLVCPEYVKAGEELKIKVDVKNTGKMQSDEVVQMYITDMESTVDTPVRQLCAFKRINLKPGETKTVELSVQPVSMSVVTPSLRRIIEEGKFSISVGNGQPLPQTANYLESEFVVEGNKEIEL